MLISLNNEQQQNCWIVVGDVATILTVLYLFTKLVEVIPIRLIQVIFP